MGLPASVIVRFRPRPAPAGPRLWCACRHLLIGTVLFAPALAVAEPSPRLVPIVAPPATAAAPTHVGLPRLVPITREQLAAVAQHRPAAVDPLPTRPTGLVPIAFAPAGTGPMLSPPAQPRAIQVQDSLRSLPVEPPTAPRPAPLAASILPPLAAAPVVPSPPSAAPLPAPPPPPVILPPLPSVAAQSRPPALAPSPPSLPPVPAALPVATAQSPVLPSVTPPAAVAALPALPALPSPSLPVTATPPPLPAPPPLPPPVADRAAPAPPTAATQAPAGPAPGAPPAVAAAGKPADAITIGSFNIQVFGESKIAKPQVVDVLVRVVRGFDVVAIQEVRAKSDSVIPQFVSAINADGSRYAFVIGPRLGRTASKEQYTFIYDTTRIELDPASVGTSLNPGDRLHRPPLHARFRTRVNPPEAGFSFWLVDTHTDPDEVKQEVDALAQVFMEMKALRPDEDDVILLGDLNASPQQFGRIRQIPGIGWAVSGVPTNTRRNKTYDNIIFDQAATAEYSGRWGVLDLQNTFGLSLDKALEVSDHNPVWATFRPWESRQMAAADAAAAVR
jgi:deoxyribonuclease-1-like protein